MTKESVRNDKILISRFSLQMSFRAKREILRFLTAFGMTGGIVISSEARNLKIPHCVRNDRGHCHFERSEKS